jgi:CheY-like chemotaxis protein
VLLVDSSSTGANLSAYMLSKLGCSIDLVSGARSAVAKLHNNFYDFVFVERSVFGMAVVSALRAIQRTLLELGSSTKVVLMSFAPSQEEQDRFVNHECFAYIDKLMLSKDLPPLLRISKRAGEANSLYVEVHSTKEIADFAEFQLMHGKAETENFVNVLIGKMKTTLSCLKIALEEGDLNWINLMVEALREPCHQISLERIYYLCTRILTEAEVGDWTELAASMTILEVEVDWTISQLEKKLAEPLPV